MQSDTAQVAFPPGVRSLPLRLQGLAVATACGALLVAAWSLSPQAGGTGTHVQMGLPGCSFLARTGYPCPSCGLTTSVSAAAHGQWGLSLSAQPFGLVLFVAAVGGALLGAAQAVTAQPLLRRLKLSRRWVWAAGLAMFAGWGVKLATGLADGSLPLR
ncbi:MAG TPA: DUF2752 domain-containing protein [Phycisphaerae bacterium]|nr:DUF2752 domain-containing protein [Phycisphaerae bacterium]